MLSPRQGRQNLAQCQLTLDDFKNVGHTPNLELPRCRAAEFSWTSRFQNLKLHAPISIEDAFRSDLTSGSRDIFIFVKLFSENNPSILAAICPGVCAIKYCSSSTGTISVSTSHMFTCRGEALSRAEPPAGPLKLELLQFSCNEPEISATTAPNAKAGKTSSERTKLEREHHDPRP